MPVSLQQRMRVTRKALESTVFAAASLFSYLTFPRIPDLDQMYTHMIKPMSSAQGGSTRWGAGEWGGKRVQPLAPSG
jgi:hypothetical protein